MKNIKITIEYDGREYHGWQKQNDKLNIQGEIERAILDITGEKVDLIGSGRTDAYRQQACDDLPPAQCCRQ